MDKVIINHKVIKEALLIRKVEETFLDLFAKGKLNGTVHTCVGQEFSALAFAGQLKQTDFIFSNHRCHGHYMAYTKDVRGLIAELLGKRSGVSGGVGSSQHLCNGNFYSNGVQGGIVPVAAGFALSNKLKKNGAIGIVFIGDGTLGEGALYETMNIISKWGIPLLIVCENNFYAQSTPQSVNLAGDILKRAEAFDIATFKCNTWDVEEIFENALESIEYVRENGKPAFHLVDTYRLNAHSKGDDDRDAEEIKKFRSRDFLVRFAKEDPAQYEQYMEKINTKVQSILDEVEQEADLTLEEYFSPPEEEGSDKWEALPFENKRQVELINAFFTSKMKDDERALFIGEDILSPYGGAFKVAKNLSALFPDRVFSTPISEAAITGISNGLALAGFKPYAEIMFGDFVTLAMDQIVNHASKFHHMYNGKVFCPVVIRTPMGGKRGYGPTHSQTLDKLVAGIDNISTVALNTLIDPGVIYEQVHREKHPVIVIENKIDYGKKVGREALANFSIQRNFEIFPVIRISPLFARPTVTIATYGGCADWITDGLHQLFKETDQVPEVIILTRISPINYVEIIASVERTNALFFVEEGSRNKGIGGEVIATVTERMGGNVTVGRVGAMGVPIPSVKSLENVVIPGIQDLINTIKRRL